MTDCPILFSAPMVRALTRGTKTQTRRVFKLPTKRIYERKDMGGWEPTINGGGGSFTIGRDGTRTPAPETVGIWHRTTGTCLDAPYQVGDRLWVRESIDKMCDSPEHEVCYMADWQGDARGLGWRPSIHMPRWASRLTLPVSEVRVQRLQDINEEDAQAEGCIKLKVTGRATEFQGGQYLGNHWPSCRAWYRELWDSLNADRGFGWDANPWVVAVSFTVEHRNIDANPAKE